MNYEELFESAKIIFFAYTNIDIRKISLKVSNEKTEFCGLNGIVSSGAEEDGSLFVCIYDLKGLNVFQCLLYLFHEFVHCIDIYNHCVLNELVVSPSSYDEEEFYLWTEFHAEKESVKLFYKFMKENQGYTNDEIEKEFFLYKEQRKDVLEKEIFKENMRFKVLYLYSRFYGRYFAFCELLEIKNKFPIDFIYDIRFLNYIKFLHQHKDEVKTKEEWEQFKRAIEAFSNN